MEQIVNETINRGGSLFIPSFAVERTQLLMIETVEHLKRAEMKPTVCIGVHAVFAGNAYEQLMNSGVALVVTCNTIPHKSNKIDLSTILAENIRDLMMPNS